MSDSESSDLIDSEAGLEENEDEMLMSSGEDEELMSSSGKEGDSENGEEEGPEEVFLEDEEGEEEEEEEEDGDDSSAEEDRKLTEDELHRLYLDDFSSDDEEAGNTIGNIPIKWYDKYDHIGYDLNGEKIMRPKSLDAIDKYIHSHDKSERWTIYDEKEGKEIKLTPRQIAIIRNIQNHQFAEPGYNDETEYIPYFSGEVSELPLIDAPPVKSSFIPSKWERRTVNQIVKRIRSGRYKPHVKKERELYEMWAEEGEERKNAPPNLMAPKLPLPDHSESYNPPDEYLFDEGEKRAWEEASPDEREKNYLPQKFACLRRVPLYGNFVKERYDRCLDLYLCPRTLKRKMNIDRNILLPQLPNINEMRPFPTTETMRLEAVEGRVRCVEVDATGYYVASGGDSKELRITEMITGRVMKTYTFPGVIQQVRWNPSPMFCDVLAVVSETAVYFIDTNLSGNEEVHANCQGLLRAHRKEKEREPVRGLTWLENDKSDAFLGEDHLLLLRHTSPVKDLSWHHKGDYVCVNASDSSSSILYIHQLSKGSTQIPITKLKGIVQRCQFSPAAHPYLFVATQTEVKIYNLVKQTLVNKLKTGVKWVSSMDIHPSGDNVIVGSYDCRLSWFDLDLSSTPYKTLRYHKKAIRKVQFHRTYPLMSTCSDDGTIHIFHTTVYNDFIHNALIVPLKVLRGHSVSGDLGVLDTAFHPTQPWIITAGADGTVRIYINIP